MGRVFKKGFNQNQNRHQNEKQSVNWDAIKEVRLIDENGAMVGIVPTSEALKKAKEAELDLINISPNVMPPVCKICDYGKFKYEQQKKQKNNNSTLKVKEMQLTMHIDVNDLNVKLKKVIQFLHNKNAVKIVMHLKGRDIQRVDDAMIVMKDVCERLKGYAKRIDEPKITGRKIITMCI